MIAHTALRDPSKLATTYQRARRKPWKTIWASNPPSVPYHIMAGSEGNLWFTEMQGNRIGQIQLTAP